jgi:hypothetical protein
MPTYQTPLSTDSESVKTHMEGRQMRLVGTRALIEREIYQWNRSDADELAAMLTGLMRVQGKDRERKSRRDG